MRYLFDLTHKQLEEIKKLIDRGKYQSLAQFISVAIENQIYIENSTDSFEILEINQKKDLSNRKHYDLIEANDKKISLKNIKKLPITVTMPKFSSLAASRNEIEEGSCWLWGQINKIFPIKLGLRILYDFMDSEQWKDLKEYRDRATNIASNYGNLIRSYEDENKKLRSERISAGLPKNKSFKSKNRYEGHFLAYMRSKDNKLDGAMSFLKFVNLKKDDKGKVFIGITDEGLNFAKLENPVIDNNNYNRSLGDIEIDFYLRHTLKHVRGESNAIKWILNKLTEGFTKRNELNQELKEDFKRIWINFSDEVINTQRAGLMARMNELKLIKTDKIGIKVEYKITEKGLRFLKNNSF